MKAEREKRISEELSPMGDISRTTFELFRTHDGEEYTVYMRDDGKRFYVDFEEQVFLILLCINTLSVKMLPSCI